MALDFVVDAFVGLDGSKYYGTLKNGVPSGLGTCIWPNQCHYDGEWRDGLMHGFGTYVWKTGQRYDGEWKDGRRDGIGIKTYADGSMYDGFWRAGKKHGLGVFRPAPEETSSRRHSNYMGWQQQQQQRLSGAGSPTGAPDDSPAAAAQAANLAGQEAAADSLSSEKHVLQPMTGHAAAADAHGTTLQELRTFKAAEANSGAGQEAQQQQHEQPHPQLQASKQHLHQQQQQQQQHLAALHKQLASGKPHLVSPFLAAAAALSSETSFLGEPPRLQNGSWQQSHTAADAAAAAASSDCTAAPGAAPAAAGAADAAVGTGSSNAPRAATAAAVEAIHGPQETTDSSLVVSGAAAVAPGSLASGPTAPRKLFVREYNVGQLTREYPLTAEEIKMIFGFLWPKANKVRRNIQRVLRRGPRMQKKMGEVVYKGNPSYTIMANLQLGIRYSVGRGPWPPSHTGSWLGAAVAPWGSSGGGHKQQQPKQQQEAQGQAGHRRQLSDALSGNTGSVPLTPGDFEEKRTLFFPTNGSSITPAHPNTDFKWNDYAPRVFRRLRRSSGIDEADYMISLGGSQALRQLSSPGKSGSMFLLSEDERFLVKTMRKSEMKVLLDMLPAYAAHMEKHPHSLITRFFGLHKLRPLHGRSVRFVVMANIFVTDLQIHRRYDIKGSTEGRTVGTEARSKAAEGDPSVIFKDLDVDLKIVLEQSAHDKLMAQVAADCDLLRSVGVMDYSLLLGVHYPTRHYTRASLEAAPSLSLDGTLPHNSPLPGGTLPGSMLGSFSEGAAAAALGAGGHELGHVPMFSSRAYTVSDDDIQQPPQQLQRLVAQQQMLSLHLQQVQQQQAYAAAAAAGPRQQQQQQPGEVFGPWSAPAAATRLTGQSSISSVGSDRDRVALEQYQGISSAGGGGLGSSLGPSPQPPNLQQYGGGSVFLSGGGEESSGSGAGQAATSLSPRQIGGTGTALQHQHSGGRVAAAQAAPHAGAGAITTQGPPQAAGGSAQAAAAAAAIAAAGAAAAAATESGTGTPQCLSSAGGASGTPAAAGSGNTSGHGAGTAHPQLLAMVGHPLAGSNAGARNWELFSGAAELEDQLVKVSERMQEMGFTEQRIKDVAELARLKILGSKLKKSAARKEPPSVVLQAMQQQRQVAEGSSGPGGTTGGGAPAPAPAATAGTPAVAHAGQEGQQGTSAAGSTAAAGLPRNQTPTLTHLTSLRGAFTGLGVPFEEDEEVVDTPMALGLPDPRAPVPLPPSVPHAASLNYTTAAGLPLGQQLGINMLALAVPQPPLGGGGGGGGTAAASAASSRRTTGSNEGQQQQQRGGGGGGRGGGGDVGRGPEEVVLCFGIIDILQDYSTRKVLERTVKGLTHDKAAISVAPPKAYARRFQQFVTSHVFMSENDYNEQRQMQTHPATQQQFTQAVSLAGRRMSETSSVDDGSGAVSPAGVTAGGSYPQQQQQYAAARQLQLQPGGHLLPIATVLPQPAAAAAGPGHGVAASPIHPQTPLLSFDEAHLLAAGAADMNLELLSSPEALTDVIIPPAGSSSGAFPSIASSSYHTFGSTSVGGAVGGAAGMSWASGVGNGPQQQQQQQEQGGQGYGHHGHQTLSQLVSAEEVSVEVAHVSEGDSSTSTNVTLQQHQQGLRVGQLTEGAPAVLVEVQQPQGLVGKDKVSAAAVMVDGKLQQQQQQQGVLGLCDEDGQAGGSSSPEEAEVIVVGSAAVAPQQQQQHGALGVGAGPLGSQHANLLAKLGA